MSGADQAPGGQAGQPPDDGLQPGRQPHHRLAGDPGLQPERTALAWQRTGVSGSLVAAGAAVAAVHLGRPWVTVCAALAAAVCVLLAAVAATPPPTRPGRVALWTADRLLATAAIPVLVGAIGCLLALT